MEFLDLPIEMICHIVKDMDIKDVLNMGLVCKELRYIVYSTNLSTQKIFCITSYNYNSVLRCNRYSIQTDKFADSDIVSNKVVMCKSPMNINIYENVRSLIINTGESIKFIPPYMGNIPVLHLYNCNVLGRDSYKNLGGERQFDLKLDNANITKVSKLGNIPKLNLTRCKRIKSFGALGGPNQKHLILSHTNIRTISPALGNIEKLDLTGCKNIFGFNVLGGPNQKELILDDVDIYVLPEHFGNIPKLSLARCLNIKNFEVLGGPNQEELILDGTKISVIPEQFGNIPKLSLNRCINIHNFNVLGGPNQKELILNNTKIHALPIHFVNIPKLSLVNCDIVHGQSYLGGPNQREIIVHKHFYKKGMNPDALKLIRIKNDEYTLQNYHYF